MPVRGRARGWPSVAAGLVVAGVLAAYAPLDEASAFGELHPLVRPIAALVGGIVIGGPWSAVLPASPGRTATRGRSPRSRPAWWWPPTRLPAASGLPRATDRRLGRGDRIGLAIVAAAVTRTAQESESPGIGAVTLVALFGAVVAAAFHMEYVGRSTESAPAAVIVVVLLLTLLVWLLLSRALVRWSGTVAGPDAARFALTCAGAAGALFAASGRNHGIDWGSGWLPLVGVVAAAAGVLLTRRRPVIPWDAAGFGAAAVVALVLATVEANISQLPDGRHAHAAFTLGAALARTAAAGAICGLLTSADPRRS